MQVVESMIAGEKKSLEEDDLLLIAMLPSANISHLYQEMQDYLKKIVGDPLLPLLDISCQQHKPLKILLEEALADRQDLADEGSEKDAKVSEF